MKKLIFAVLSVAVLGGAVILSARHYDQYQLKNQKQEARVAAEVASVEKRQANQLAVANNRAQVLQAECKKGLVAYEKLTPFVRAQTPKPVCS